MTEILLKRTYNRKSYIIQFLCLFYLYLFFFFFLSPYYSSKISPQSIKMEALFLVYGMAKGLFVIKLHCIYSFFFSSIFLPKISPQPYREIENEPFYICSSLHLFIFLSLYAFSTVIFCKRFLSSCSRYDAHF